MKTRGRGSGNAQKTGKHGCEKNVQKARDGNVDGGPTLIEIVQFQFIIKMTYFLPQRYDCAGNGHTREYPSFLNLVAKPSIQNRILFQTFSLSTA
jgi:hypothetical protein